VRFALTEAQTGDIIIRKMNSVCLRDIIALFDGTRVNVVGKRPARRARDPLRQGEINTGYETDEYYVLTAVAEKALRWTTMRLLAGFRACAPDQLRGWFEKVTRQRPDTGTSEDCPQSEPEASATVERSTVADASGSDGHSELSGEQLRNDS